MMIDNMIFLFDGIKRIILKVSCWEFATRVNLVISGTFFPALTVFTV